MGTASRVGRRPVATTLVVAVALLVVQAQAMIRLDLGGVAGHAIGHLGMAVPFLLVAGAVAVWWPSPPPTRSGRAGRWLLLLGLVAVGGGGLLEGLGAIGDRSPTPGVLRRIHDLGVLVTVTGLPLMVVGGLTSIAAAARWHGWLRERWFRVTVATATVVAVAYLAGAFLGWY